ncbi:hypothetical protein KEM54_006024 [Ascosphaera aggregata]|nr:hypothetical protein KEM54_006024 [Ascosphaera aggregata]
MKFAKELQDQLVPEWQAKYFDYKIGKKKVKAIAKALKAFETTSSPSSKLPTLSNIPRRSYHLASSHSTFPPRQTPQRQSQQQPPTVQGLFDASLSSLPIGIPERTPLCSPAIAPQPGSYGSIIASPPDERDAYLENLELPDPALSPDPSETARAPNSPTQSTPRPAKRGSKENSVRTNKLERIRSGNGNDHSVSRSCNGGARSFLPFWTPSFRGTPGADSGQKRSISRLHRVFSAGDRGQRKDNEASISEAYKEFEAREVNFVSFLDGELEKIEDFYKQKEDEFTRRLRSLRDQLHLLRDMRIAELRRKRSSTVSRSGINEEDGFTTDASGDKKKKESGWRRRLASRQRNQSSFTATTPVHPRPMSMGTSDEGEQHRIERKQQRRDFARKLEQDIPYRTAKRRLKVALIEFYRGLELLKSYAELNHKAFRKINKKYDKVTHARPTLRYLTENVNRARFVQSEVLDTYLSTVEDLYSRYFENGNRKIAVGKLRGKLHRTEDYSASTFRNGFMFSAGFVLGVQGVVSAGQHLFDPDPVVRMQTSYLLQNIALFFCLYGHKFQNAHQCNSSHSRAMGFMSTVPAIIRGLQCLRRYIDTKNSFPHLVNMGKYTSTLVFYVMLSLYRIDRRSDLRAIFITFAVINALYSSTWDLAMDWSLGNIYSKNWGLRDSLALRRKWVYYAAMVLDPILRFNWIFYIIFPRDFQHSALLSFIVALSEVVRRGMWVIFRVENEHCTNVELFRASRDVPLPYEIPSSAPVTPRQAESFSQGRIQRVTGRPFEGSEGEPLAAKAQSPFSFFREQPRTSASRGGPASQDPSNGSPCFNAASDMERTASQALRHDSRYERRSSLSRMGTILAMAHTQDFERRLPAGNAPNGADGSMSSSEDEEEEPDGILSGSDGKRANEDGETGRGDNHRAGGRPDTSSA